MRLQDLPLLGTPQHDFFLMTESSIKAVACVYGLFGLLSLPTVFFLWKYIGQLNQLHPDEFSSNIVFILIPLANSILCFLISYLTWSFNRVGSYLAFAYNGSWIVSFTVGPIVGRLTEKNFPEVTISAIVFWLIVIAIFGGLTWLLLLPTVAARMKR